MLAAVTQQGAVAKNPLQAIFSQTDNIDYNDLLPAALVDMSELFVSDTGQFTKYTEGSAGTTSIASNAMSVVHVGGKNDIVKQNTTAIALPQLWVEATINVSTTGATSYDNGGVGIVKDANNFLFASNDRINSFIRVQIKIGGTNNFLASISQSFGTSFKLALSLIGNSVCVYIDTGSGWVYKTGIDVTSYYDFRTSGNLTGWNPGFTLANGGGNSTWQFSNFKAGRFGAIGLRDMTIVTNENGTPYYPGVDVIYFTATASDPRGGGYCGVFSLDLVSKAIVQKSVILVSRSGKIYTDLSAHIIYYSNGNRRLLIGTWGNGFGGVIQTLYGLLTSGDILTGSNVVSGLTQLSLPQSGASPGCYDAMMAWDAKNSRWLLVYAMTQCTDFVGSPFYISAAYSTDLTTWTLIGADSSRQGYEGAKILFSNNRFWILGGGPAGAGTDAIVYDASMIYKGTLKLTLAGGADTQPHPMIFLYKSKFVVLSFDNTKLNGGSFTWGNMRIYTQN